MCSIIKYICGDGINIFIKKIKRRVFILIEHRSPRAIGAIGAVGSLIFADFTIIPTFLKYFNVKGVIKKRNIKNKVVFGGIKNKDLFFILFFISLF